MDPAPRAYDELPHDSTLGITVPFACSGELQSAKLIDRRRVIQCALSRICGICGASLGRPIAFLGSQEEAARNAFHFPPAHLECAERMLAEVEDVPVAVLGQDAPPAGWALVTTGGFEFVRPGRDDVDRRPVFEPNSLLDAAS
ncbi:MAG TPA: hypothetical protein VFK52_10640 [Nocardioidaceae bacterium]|nr:hypothetical protein [Nocardioidaceae bacterium]